MATFEKCSFENGKLNKKSPVVEVFSALTMGKEIGGIKGADACQKHLAETCSKASKGDVTAISELNSIRRYVIEPELLKELKMLNIFGTYENVGYNESIEVEVPQYAGQKSRPQAAGGDVVFNGIVSEKYTVPTYTVSGGYAVDYRKMAMGDMELENAGMEQTRIDIRNKATRYCMDKIYNAIKNATGVKFTAEDGGITQTDLDKIVKGIRRFGKTTLTGDYSMVSQLAAFEMFTSGSFGFIDDAALQELRKTGLIGDYKGSTVVEIPNEYDTTEIFENAGEKYFKTIAPDNLLFVLPTGIKSPIKTWTRGGLTTFTGNDVTTGKILTRFDLEVACDIAKGREYQIGVIKDTNVL